LNSQVFLCFGNSVASTRFMLQDEFNIQTTRCDNCIIVCSCSSLSLSQISIHNIFAYLQLFKHVACSYSGFYVLPPTNCMHIFYSCNDCWKWRNSRGFPVAILFGWYGVLHVSIYTHILILNAFNPIGLQLSHWFCCFILFPSGQGLCLYAGMLLIHKTPHKILVFWMTSNQLC
jgi:hypothetical protein